MPLKNQLATPEYQKEYREKNKEHIKEIINNWRLKNRDRIKQQRRAHYLNHPELKDKQKDRQNKRNHELQTMIKKIILEKGKCERCGFSDVRALVVHHPNGNRTRKNNYKTYKDIIEGKVSYEVICMNCHVIHHGTLKNTRNF